MKILKISLLALVLPGLLLSLGACGQKDISFTDYIIEHLLRDNLNALAKPPIFEVRAVTIISSESTGDQGSALADVALHFPEGFATVAEQRGLQPDSMEYRQYQSSFGNFEAGEIQTHHARYEFLRRDGKWRIIGSQPVAAPDIAKP